MNNASAGVSPRNGNRGRTLRAASDEALRPLETRRMASQDRKELVI